MQKASRSDWLVFLALGLMWGSSYFFIKLGVQTLPTFTLIAGRLGIGAAVLVAIAAVNRDPLPRERRIYAHLVVMAIISIVLPFALITTAEQSVDSAIASIITATTPLFIVFIAAFFLRDEPLRVNRIAGLLVGFAGAVILVLGGPRSGSGALPPNIGGDLLLLLSSVSYAVGGVYTRRNVPGVRTRTIAMFQVGFAFLLASTLALAFEHPLDVQWNFDAVIAVLWLGVLGSGLAYLANFRLLFRWGATRTSLVTYVIPIVGIIFGAVGFHEVVDARVILGTILIVGGVVLVNGRFGQRQLFVRTTPEAPAD